MSNVQQEQQAEHKDVMGAQQKYIEWQHEQVASEAKAKIAKAVSEQRRMDCNPPFDKELIKNQPTQDVAQGQPYRARLPEREEEKGLIDKAKDLFGLGDNKKTNNKWACLKTDMWLLFEIKHLLCQKKFAFGEIFMINSFQ